MKLEFAGSEKKYRAARFLAPVIHKNGPAEAKIYGYLKAMNLPSAKLVNEKIARTGFEDGECNLINADTLYLEAYRFLLENVCDIPYSVCEHICDEAYCRLYSVLTGGDVSFSSNIISSVTMKLEGVDPDLFRWNALGRRRRGFIPRRYKLPYGFSDAIAAVDNCVAIFENNLRETVKAHPKTDPLLSNRIGDSNHIYDDSDFPWDVGGEIAESFLYHFIAYVRYRAFGVLDMKEVESLYPIKGVLFNPSTMVIVPKATYDYYYTMLHGNELDFKDLTKAVAYLSKRYGLAINAHILMMAMELGESYDEINDIKNDPD